MQSCDQEDCPTLLDGNSDDLPIPALEPGAVSQMLSMNF